MALPQSSLRTKDIHRAFARNRIAFGAPLLPGHGTGPAYWAQRGRASRGAVDGTLRDACERHTILRQLKRAAKERPPTPSLRAIGIDDWAWRKGQTYGTIMVDLEQRTVVDLLPDRSAITAASWLAEHPTIEIVSRDRCGLYATAAVSGAPHARQAADRFHLIQNLREAIEKQLGGIWRPIRIAGHPAAPAGENDNLPREALEQRSQAVQARSAIFMQVRTLYEAGNTAAEIVRELGLSRKRVDKWICLQTLPTRNPMAPKPCTPAFYKAYIESRWAEGYQNGRGLFNEIKHLGYTGCFS